MIGRMSQEQKEEAEGVCFFWLTTHGHVCLNPQPVLHLRAMVRHADTNTQTHTEIKHDFFCQLFLQSAVCIEL